jgi:hypothetical protein
MQAPTRARGSYIMFSTERLNQMKGQDGPQFEKMKKIAAEWKILGDGQQKYVIMADKDKLRYQ